MWSNCVENVCSILVDAPYVRVQIPRCILVYTCVCACTCMCVCVCNSSASKQLSYSHELSHFSCVQLFATLQAIAHQVSLSGILQARILEWVAMPSSRGFSQPRNQTLVSCVSCIAGRVFTAEPLGKPKQLSYNCPYL